MIGNILSLAMGAIGSQTAAWQKFKDRTTNEAGHKVQSYYPTKNIVGSVQPVSQKAMQALGLDMNKRYVTLYTPADVVAVERDGSGDRIVYAGDVYLCESDTPWRAQAGWVSVLCVKVPA